VIGFLYDARYVGAKPLFLILMCRVLIRGVGQMQFQLLLSQNRIRIGTVAYLVALCVQAASIVPLTQAFGVQGLAISVLLSTTCVTATQAMLSARLADFGLSPVSRTLAWMNVPLIFLAIVT
jgi:O-antigen/teichoic acid export membrane protein